jgi:hypothetical protein
MGSAHHLHASTPGGRIRSSTSASMVLHGHCSSVRRSGIHGDATHSLIPMLRRDLLLQLAAQSDSGAVQRQLRLGNADLANANLAKEAEIAELRNQIAIIRCLCLYAALSLGVICVMPVWHTFVRACSDVADYPPQVVRVCACKGSL